MILMLSIGNCKSLMHLNVLIIECINLNLVWKNNNFFPFIFEKSTVKQIVKFITQFFLITQITNSIRSVNTKSTLNEANLTSATQTLNFNPTMHYGKNRN
jgi:hypothetical protein